MRRAAMVGRAAVPGRRWVCVCVCVVYVLLLLVLLTRGRTKARVVYLAALTPDM